MCFRRPDRVRASAARRCVAVERRQPAADQRSLNARIDGGSAVKLVKLASIRPGRSIPIKNLSAPRLTELQIALTKLGYPVGDIHGLYGPELAAPGEKRLPT